MIKKIIIMFLISVIIVGCGFHLRGRAGDYKFPFKSVYVDCTSAAAICPYFTHAITAQDITKLVQKPESAEVTIKIINEETSRDAQGFTSVGRVSAYLLTYSITAQIYKSHEQLGNDINVRSQSVMQYNDSTILSNDQNETSFWDQLHQNVTNQLIRRITFFKINPNESGSN